MVFVTKTNGFLQPQIMVCHRKLMVFATTNVFVRRNYSFWLQNILFFCNKRWSCSQPEPIVCSTTNKRFCNKKNGICKKHNSFCNQNRWLLQLTLIVFATTTYVFFATKTDSFYSQKLMVFANQKGRFLQPQRTVLATKKDGFWNQEGWFLQQKKVPATKKASSCNKKGWFWQPQKIILATSKRMVCATKK